MQDRFVASKIPVVFKAPLVQFKAGDKATHSIMNGRFELTTEIIDIGRRGMHLKFTVKDLQDDSEHVISDDSG